VQRRSTEIAVILAAVLTCSLMTSTTFAYYRASIGPKRCCATHCRHAMPKRVAEQCCRAHPEAAPAATAKIMPPDAAVPIFFVAVTHAPTAMPAVVPQRSDGRPPPGYTLLAQHTSLAL
jgi:hypothetical protein